MFQEWFKDYERIIKEGREAMTKEQEEAIEYLEESILIYKNTIPKISEAIETLLSMLKEKDKEIEKYKYLYQKALDNTIEADRENIQLKKQIDLMAEFMLGGLEDFAFNAICKKSKCVYELKDNRPTKCRQCKDCITQYFERKVEDERI